MDIFNKILEINPKDIICNSGGAEGSDTVWELYSTIYGLKVNAFSYKTKSHKSINKVEISEDDYIEGVNKIKKANKILCRSNIDKYMNLLARNWAQVKYSEEIFAIGDIVKNGDKNKSGFIVKSKKPTVDGGTGYAVQMAIMHEKTVYVFNQIDNSWYKWSYISENFLKLNKTPKINAKSFAGIGTRKISSIAEEAINQVFIETFKKNNF